MTPSEVARHLQSPSLLTDITMPQPREAVKWAAEYVLDLKDLLLTVEMYLEKPDELRRQLMADCFANTKARAAA
jgi:hypothetical protein